MPGRKPAALLVAVVCAAAGVLALAVRIRPAVAAAALTKVQIGTAASVGSGNVTLTLTAASTAGNLLVATLASNNTAAFTAPSGWVRGPHVTNSAAAEIWYYPNNPGGISSAVFGNSGTTFTAGQLSEWSGAAKTSPLDQSPTATATGASLTVTSASSTVAPGEVGISSFVQGGSPTLTAGTGWTRAGTRSGGVYAYASDYQNGLAKSTVSETETSNKSAAFAGVVATFEPTCSTGALGLTPPASVSFGALTLNGHNQTTTASPVSTVDDETNSYAGWNLQLTSTLFTNAGAKTMAPGATTLTSASGSAATGSCIVPTNSVTYPVTVPAGSSPPTAVKVFNASASTGVGPNNVTLNASLAVPANTFSGSYTSTWTLTVASGP